MAQKSPSVLHGVGKVRIFPESDLLKWGASYMPMHPVCRQIRYLMGSTYFTQKVYEKLIGGTELEKCFDQNVHVFKAFHLTLFQKNCHNGKRIKKSGYLVFIGLKSSSDWLEKD